MKNKFNIKSIKSKLSLCLGGFATIFSAQAMAWEKIAECNHGAVVIDTECSSYRGAPCYVRNFQMVVRDQGVANYFRQNHADGIYSYNAGQPYWSWVDGELIIPLRRNADGFSFEGDKFVNLSIPYADSGYVARYYVKRTGNSLSVEAFKQTNTRNDIVNEGLLANWNFEDCQF